MGSPAPSLLATNTLIRREAAEFYYLRNTFRIVVRDFHPRVLLRLERRLSAVNIDLHSFWANAHIFAHVQLRRADSWRDLKIWLKLWHQGHRLPFGFPPPGATPQSLRHARGWSVVGAMFLTADHLSGIPWVNVERVMEELRGVLMVVIHWGNVHDQLLIPLARIPLVIPSSSATT